jgi:hypothetical protein
MFAYHAPRFAALAAAAALSALVLIGPAYASPTHACMTQALATTR